TSGRASAARKASWWRKSARSGGGLVGLGGGEERDPEYRYAALAKLAVGHSHASPALPPPGLPAAAGLADEVEHHVGHCPATVPPPAPPPRSDSATSR